MGGRVVLKLDDLTDIEIQNYTFSDVKGFEENGKRIESGLIVITFSGNYGHFAELFRPYLINGKPIKKAFIKHQKVFGSRKGFRETHSIVLMDCIVDGLSFEPEGEQISYIMSIKFKDLSSPAAVPKRKSPFKLRGLRKYLTNP